jgi:hypothetical protein
MAKQRNNDPLGGGFLTGGTDILRLLSGAFELSIEVPSPKSAALSTLMKDFESEVRPYLAIDQELYDSDLIGFRIRISRIIDKIEAYGFGVYGFLEPPSTNNPRPQAKFQLRKHRRQPTGPRFRLPSKPQSPELDDSEHWVWWDSTTSEDIVGLREELEVAKDERSVHRFLESHRVLLVEAFNSGHGRWVYPRVWLGKDHEIDFLVATRDSTGFEWTAIELEPPNVRPFTKAGRPSARLNEAIDQVKEWRVWLQTNLDNARRSEADHGLGLTDISARCHSVILIGRSQNFPDVRQEWRRHLRDNDGIEIHSYDWLLEKASARIRTKPRI